MAGVKALRKIQLGKETTAGTAVAATNIWRGLGTIEDQREIVVADEDVGVLLRPSRPYTARYQAGLTLEPVEATFEQLPYILEMGMKGIWTAGTADAGSGKVYAYSVGTTAAQTINTFTIEGGDNEQAEEMEYAFCRSFTLSGDSGQAWMMSAELVGRQVATASFTTSISIPTVEEMLFPKTTLYINTAGSVGTTSKSNTLMAAELNVSNTGFVPVYTADGQLYFGWHKGQGAEATLTLTFEHETTSIAEIAAWRAGTERAIRLLTTGAALATTGTTHTTKKMIIDCWGRWERFTKLGDRDGNDIVEGTLRIGYSPTAAKALEITIVNELATLV